MNLHWDSYEPDVQQLLASAGRGERALPLHLPEQGWGAPPSMDRLTGSIFRNSKHRTGALTGLWLYFGSWVQAHEVAQEDGSPEGSYWHGIIHRLEHDEPNCGYWMRRVENHTLFPRVAEEARALGYEVEEWDPMRFARFCIHSAEEPESDDANLARAVQLVEWQLLFEFCARPRSGGGGISR